MAVPEYPVSGLSHVLKRYDVYPNSESSVMIRLLSFASLSLRCLISDKQITVGRNVFRNLFNTPVLSTCLRPLIFQKYIVQSLGVGQSSTITGLCAVIASLAVSKRCCIRFRLRRVSGPSSSASSSEISISSWFSIPRAASTLV